MHWSGKEEWGVVDGWFLDGWLVSGTQVDSFVVVGKKRGVGSG